MNESQLGRADAAASRVVAYASHVVDDCSSDSVIEVMHFDAGENHVVYKLSYIGEAGRTKQIVIRIASSERARDTAFASWEATVLRKVQGVAAPTLHDFRCDDEWFGAPVMCTDFVEGAQRSPDSAQERESLGVTIARLHALPTHDLGVDVPELSAKAYLDQRLVKLSEKLPWVRDPLPEEVQRRLRTAVRLVEEHAETARRSRDFETADSLVLLHGDAAGGNIIWTPVPILIDWEYARIGDPADEISYILMQHGWSEEERAQFRRGYERGNAGVRPTEHVFDRVRWWEPVTTLGSAFFWVQSWSRCAAAEMAGTAEPTTPREQGYYAENALTRLRRCEQLLVGTIDSKARGPRP